MSNYWSPLVHRLTPYVAGEQPSTPGLIKLNTNENPYPPSPRVIQAITQAAGDALRLYPDPGSLALRQALARHFDLLADQVFVGNGSDEVLGHVFQGLLRHDRPLLLPDITYSFYTVYCHLYDIRYEAVSVNQAFEIDLAHYHPPYRAPSGGIIFANPNAPTGIALALPQIEHLLQQHSHSVVVIDEAYVDFGGQSAVPLIAHYPNLLVVQTFSKSRALAGMRIGFALGHRDLIAGLERVKNSFNSYPLSQLASVAAIAALEDQPYFEQITQSVVQSREQLRADLQALGFEVLPSKANFLFVSHPRWDAALLYRRLRDRAILVRHFALPRIEPFLRITIGTPDQCAALVTALQALC